MHTRCYNAAVRLAESLIDCVRLQAANKAKQSLQKQLAVCQEQLLQAERQLQQHVVTQAQGMYA